MARKSSSARRSADWNRKQLVPYSSKKSSSGRKRKSSHRKSSHRKSSSSKGISEDALAVLLLSRTEQEGKCVDNILPFLLLSGNSLKHSMLPIVILHLQNNKNCKSNILPYLLAFSQGSLGEDQLLPMLLMMRDGNGGMGGFGQGFGTGSGGMLANIMGIQGKLGGQWGQMLGWGGLLNQNQGQAAPKMISGGNSAQGSLQSLYQGSEANIEPFRSLRASRW